MAMRSMLRSVFLGKTGNTYMLLVVAVLVAAVGRVWAQDAAVNPPTFNIAVTMSIVEPEAVSGDIVSLTDQNDTVTRSKKTSDERMHGVLIETPVVVYRTLDTLPLARSGDAYVNVTTLGGPIKVGDYISSSEIPGKGQRAENVTGYMVGVSLQNFDGSTGTDVTYEGKTYKTGSVKAAIGIGPASPAQIKAAGGLFGTLRFIASSFLYNLGASKQFERLFRIILAALIALMVIYISFRTFGRNVTKGIEAIGRNPLARGTIQSMIIVNVVLIFVVSLGGVLLSLAIMSL